MEKDKVSVIVPVYNTKSEFLNKCMDTILNQTYKNFEVIIIDDGSQKGTSDLCDEWQTKDSRINVIHKENEGVSEARNIGISKATGRWLVFVDSDDWIEIDAIEKMIEKSNDMDVVIARSFIDNDKKITPNNDEEIVINENYELINNLFLDKPKITIVGAVWGKLYLREIVIKNKIKFSKKLKMGEDYLFNFDYFLYAKKAKYIPDYLFHYRNDNNDSVTRKYDKKLFEKYNSLFGELEERMNNRNDLIIKESGEVFIIRQLDYFFFLGVYRDNNLKLKERINILKDIFNVKTCKSAIKNVKLDLLTRGNQIFVVFLRFRLYIFVDLLLNMKRRYKCKKN